MYYTIPEPLKWNLIKIAMEDPYCKWPNNSHFVLYPSKEVMCIKSG